MRRDVNIQRDVNPVEPQRDAARRRSGDDRRALLMTHFPFPPPLIHRTNKNLLSLSMKIYETEDGVTRRMKRGFFSSLSKRTRTTRYHMIQLSFHRSSRPGFGETSMRKYTHEFTRSTAPPHHRQSCPIQSNPIRSQSKKTFATIELRSTSPKKKSLVFFFLFSSS